MLDFNDVLSQRLEVNHKTDLTDVSDHTRHKYWLKYQDMGKIEVFRVLMTPEMATKILNGSSIKNRKANKKNEQRLQRDVIRGDYSVTHQGIALSPDMDVVDGHHRLRVCIATGIALPMFVFMNVPKESMPFVDRGYGRTVDQDLDMDGLDQAKVRVALARSCIELLGYVSTNLGNKPDYDAWMPLFDEGISFAIQTMRSRVRGTARTAPVIGSFAFAYPTDREGVMKAAEGFVTGAHLDENDPMNKLREHLALEKNRNRGQKPRAQLGKATTWAIFKAIQGKKTKRMAIKEDGNEFFKKYYADNFKDEIAHILPKKAKLVLV